MSLLPAIPRDPRARLRLLSLWFALFAVVIALVETTISRPEPLALRITGLSAAILLGIWLSVGYRRGRFPEFSAPLEAILLTAVAAASSLPLRAMGLYLTTLMLRSLYLSRREFWTVPVFYAIARVLGIALTQQPAPYGPFSTTVAVQAIGLTIVCAILYLLMQALEGQTRAEAQLREAQKMEAVGQLAGGIAHDFNNLLTVIGGHVFMIEQHTTLGPTAMKHLDGIMETAERAGALTRQLLAFGGRQLLHPKTIDLNVVVRDSARLLGPAIGERIRIVVDLDPDLQRVHADVGQIEQVLLNLGINARDAMPHGGTIYIATSNVETPAGTRARVTFEDTGVGMDAETLARVFEPFFTTKRGGRGTGLGLATAYGIIKQSAGDISAVSNPGKGSTFTITLPVVPHGVPENAEHRPSARQGTSRPLGVTRVLLVEDDDGVRDFAREVLTRAGVRVAIASDGAEGVAIARAHGYEFDLIVTDIVMPEVNGPQMVARIREGRPDIPVLFVTGWADNAVTREDMQPGKEGLIEKPFTAQALRDAIQRLVAGRVEKPALI